MVSKASMSGCAQLDLTLPVPSSRGGSISGSTTNAFSGSLATVSDSSRF